MTINYQYEDHREIRVYYKSTRPANKINPNKGILKLQLRGLNHTLARMQVKHTMHRYPEDTNSAISQLIEAETRNIQQAGEACKAQAGNISKKEERIIEQTLQAMNTSQKHRPFREC